MAEQSERERTAAEHLAATSRGIGHLESRLRVIAALLATDLLEVVVGGAENDQELENSPVQGRRRYVIARRTRGGDDAVYPIAFDQAAHDVAPANPGRLGGQIVNAGANPVMLYLSLAREVAAGGKAAIWLGANGGSWDFRLSNVLYGGPVSAVARVGATSLTLAEA